MEVGDLDSTALRAVFMRIDNFSGEFDFLDPNYRCRVVFMGVDFRSVGHGVRFLRFSHTVGGQKYHYDASNPLSKDVIGYISQMDSDAHPDGLEENPLWTAHRHEWLELLLRDKFRRNGDVRSRLAKTGDRKIVYISDDLFLGSDGKNGQNKIGRITEQIRDDMLAYKDHRVWLFMCQNMSAEDFWVSIEESSGNDNSQRHRLEGKSCYDIGRLPTCHLKPANPSISRIHATICMNKRGSVCMVNYNSATGVTVNGHALEPHEPFALSSGDRFTLGASKRIYRLHIDPHLVSHRAAQAAEKRREVQRKAEAESRRVNTELETFLKGHDEVGACAPRCHPFQVVVLNLSYKTKRSDLYDFFSSCGAVESVQLPQSRGSGDDPASDEALAQRGIAFIKFRDKKGAACALERDGMYLNYRRIQVKYKSDHGFEPRRREWRPPSSPPRPAPREIRPRNGHYHRERRSPSFSASRRSRRSYGRSRSRSHSRRSRSPSRYSRDRHHRY
ncbi:FHA domain-containing protein [Babesia caballi]|uniref:FHA domain-containing protein n=1 Tax=Babesia caballi TaxID=5871 RepID=A0AAV4LVL9_BABCB|nr:FHA domain-containing protein [Babesia caballi]